MKLDYYLVVESLEAHEEEIRKQERTKVIAELEECINDKTTIHQIERIINMLESQRGHDWTKIEEYERLDIITWLENLNNVHKKLNEMKEV